MSRRFGNVESRPSKIVRPRSGEPLGEWNSRAANLIVSARCVCAGSDCVARERRVRARSGAERVVWRNWA